MSDIDDLAGAVLGGARRALARAITLIESTRADHQARAQALLARILPKTGGAMRIGISGAPGVGKSSFIEAFGLYLVEAGHRVAVLAVDPSSKRSGGALLGDKTRMAELARNPAAFIRPSPAGATLGGVARRTREAFDLFFAASPSRPDHNDVLKRRAFGLPALRQSLRSFSGKRSVRSFLCRFTLSPRP